MFPADSLNPQYVEEQTVAFAARRQAKTLGVPSGALSSAASSAATSPCATRSPSPAGFAHPQQSNVESRSPDMSQTLQQRPQLSRPGSSNFLGNIFQGFVRATGGPIPQASAFVSNSALSTPEKEKSQNEIAALIAEKKRDADICAMPAWYH